MKSRPFAYNPSLTPIPGTEQVGTLAVGITQQDYSLSPGGVQWWNGPDETLGYIICLSVPTGDFPTPVGNIGTVQFWRSTELTTPSFLEITNLVFSGQSFTTGSDAKSWLNTNGYWTSWNSALTYSTILLDWPSAPSGYTLYDGNFTDIDDGHNETPITIESFSMASSASTILYVSINGYITFTNPMSSTLDPRFISPYISPATGGTATLIAGNTWDNYLRRGKVMIDGDTENLYYQSFEDDVCKQTKIMVYCERYDEHSGELTGGTATSYLLNLYRDSNYQWIETRIKSNMSRGDSRVGPNSTTDVSVLASTTSHVWRGDLNGENWTYMGTGSVLR